MVSVIRFETQTATVPGRSPPSRTMAKAATGKRSRPTLSTSVMMSADGLAGVISTWNGAAASSPVIRAIALRVSSSSAAGEITTTRPRDGAWPEGGVAGGVPVACKARSRAGAIIPVGAASVRSPAHRTTDTGNWQ